MVVTSYSPSKSKSRFFKRLRAYFREYCSRTSIHGFQYFGEKNRTELEKLWWFVAIGASLGTCIYIILVMYNHYKAAPIIVTFATRSTPISKIPFPAVTICPESVSVNTKLNFSRLEEAAENGSCTADEMKVYEYASQVCDAEFETNYSNVTLIENATDLYQTLFEVKPNFLENTECKWLNVDFHCSELFTEIITDEGICYGFNLLDRNEMFRKEVYLYEKFQNVNKTAQGWMDTGGYTDNESLASYPYRSLLAGTRDSLLVTITTYDSEIDYKCSGYLQGFKVSFHIPERYPLFNEDHILVPLDEYVAVAVQPSMVTTSSVVKKYDPKVRMCYFPHEKYLRYFKTYTLNNCKTECWANYTLESCGCVSFYMPHTADTPICGTQTIYSCVKRATAKIHQWKDAEYSDDSYSEDDSYHPMDACECLPLCSDLNYNLLISQANMGWDKFYQAYHYTKNETSSMRLTILRIYFKTAHFITSQRNELYGPIGFLANFGGVIALFTGVSILSVVEIVYFCTCRLFCNIRIHGKNQWLGPDV